MCVKGHDLVDVVLAELAGGLLIDYTAPPDPDMRLAADVVAE